MQGFFLRNKFWSRSFQLYRQFTVDPPLHKDVCDVHMSHKVTTTMADCELNCQRSQ